MMLDNRGHGLTSTGTRKTRLMIWQMPEFWLRLCGKVVGSSTIIPELHKIKRHEYMHSETIFWPTFSYVSARLIYF
jgi:hypothetical protein